RVYPARKNEQPKIEPYAHDRSREELPPEQEITASEFFRDILGFRDNEYVWFARKEQQDGEAAFIQDTEGVRVSDLGKPVQDGWPAFDDCLILQGLGDRGAFYAVNPLKTGSSRKTENVSRFLHTLLEHDSLPKEEQLAIYQKLNLPIVALVDTGN